MGIATKKKRDPKVGTGKKPKGSDRSLYTDENPKDTVSIKFATSTDTRATQLEKLKRSINHMRERYRYLQSVSKEQK